jgi:Tol biopolymer transport system component
LTIRILNWMGTAVLALIAACGSDVVDVGNVGGGAGAGGTDGLGGNGPDGFGGGGPDAGSPDLNARCTIANLNQYRIVFDSDNGRLEQRIYSMRADGTSLEPLTPVDEIARDPALSPDGRQLAYVVSDGIKLLDLANGQSEVLVPGADQPSWSSDGARLVYRSRDNTRIEIMTLSDRTIAAPLSPTQFYAQPELTPEGAGLVYADSLPLSGIELTSALSSINLEAQTIHNIVPPAPIEIAHPSSSPDGLWVAASYRCDGSEPPSLWLTPSLLTTPACEGRRVTRVGAPDVTNPQWGPSALIAYERGESPRDIAIIAADTGEECTIQRPGDDRNPSWGAFAISALD